MNSLMRKLQILLLSFTMFQFFSCEANTVGWGVLYITDEGQQLTAGGVYPITQISEIRDSYTIQQQGSKDVKDVPKWKMAFFEKQEDAINFSSEYSQWLPFYAKSTMNGLSIREEPDINSDRLYKLKEGQELKIIGRTEKKEAIAKHEGYWFLVLTKDGTKGYCFDKNLVIYDTKTNEKTVSNTLDTGSLGYFIEKPFRPEFFLEMINKQSFDFTKFKLSRGIFAYPDEKKVVISKQDFQAVFEYTDIIQNSRGRFIFEGSSLQIEVRSEDKIVAYYNYNNKEYAEVMVYIAGLDKIINDENNRRKLLIDKLISFGRISSKAYGKISFSGENTFWWNNYNLLVPNVIPDGTVSRGTISIRYPIGLDLKDSYDGVLSFSFEKHTEEYVNFLFKLSDLGVKFVYVSPRDIVDNVVYSENSSPLVIFMSAAGE